MPALPEPNPRERILAEHIQTLSRELARVRAMVESPERKIIKSILQGGGGIRSEHLIQCVVGDIFPANADVVATQAGLVTYDIVGRRRAGIVETGLTPYYGRPVRDPTHMIFAARRGDDCWLVRTMDGSEQGQFRPLLLVLSEYRAHRICPGL